jgi:hypothetical protein
VFLEDRATWCVVKAASARQAGEEGPGVGEAVTWIWGESLRAVVHLKEDHDAVRCADDDLAR